jgi:hypothetical protein
MHFIRVSSSFGLVLLSLLAFSNCTTVNKQVRELKPRDAARIAPYAMMTANSYHHKCDWFPLQPLGWVQVDLSGKQSDDPTYSHRFSLAYDIYRNDRQHEYVFVYRGTDSLLDFAWANLAPFVSLEYRLAERHFNKFLNSRPPQFKQYKIVLAGHSLGAGLALHESIRGFDAFVFDPSPRLFGPSSSQYRKGKRVVVFQKGEILALLRARTSLWYAAATGGVYQTEFDFGPEVNRKQGISKRVGLHDMFKLAEHIRAEGAPVNSHLNEAKLSRRPEAECDSANNQKPH